MIAFRQTIAIHIDLFLCPSLYRYTCHGWRSPGSFCYLLALTEIGHLLNLLKHGQDLLEERAGSWRSIGQRCVFGGTIGSALYRSGGIPWCTPLSPDGTKTSYCLSWVGIVSAIWRGKMSIGGPLPALARAPWPWSLAALIQRTQQPNLHAWPRSAFRRSSCLALDQGRWWYQKAYPHELLRHNRESLWPSLSNPHLLMLAELQWFNFWGSLDPHFAIHRFSRIFGDEKLQICSCLGKALRILPGFDLD